MFIRSLDVPGTVRSRSLAGGAAATIDKTIIIVIYARYPPGRWLLSSDYRTLVVEI